MPSLEERVAASSYLSGLNRHHPELLNTEVSAATLETIIAEVRDYPASAWGATDELTDYLLSVKQRFALLWSIGELQRTVSFADLGRLQSEFAGATIDLALQGAWRSDALKAVAKSLPEQTFVPGLFVLGLGKLGGYDLNFSSDVDLIAYYDPQVLPVSSMHGQGYICNRVLQVMSGLLQPTGKVDFVWRVDWRLRPNASSSQLSMPTEVAQEYYFFKALPWHRLALMKARVVAGDLSLGQQFLEQLRPFIWRQNLDFRALDELAHIKQRINLEHPGLRVQRAWRDPIGEECAGFNVKLGSGGIREIEFIANALQLVWGGKQYPLRTTNTLQALEQLVVNGHLPDEVARQLRDSYEYLRHLENAIQMRGNAQTHSLPSDDTGQANLLLLLGLDNWSELQSGVLSVRTFINEEFSRFFHQEDSEAASATVFELPDEWVEALDARGKAIVQNWRNGFIDYGVPNTLGERLSDLSSRISESVYQAGAQPDDALARVDDFFRSMPQTAQYFRLLQNSPELLNSIVPPLLYSPAMTTLLRQSPHIIDCFIDPQYSSVERGLEQGTEFIFLTEDYGVRLERIRRFVNESLYQHYLAFMQGDIAVPQLQNRLTELASHTLDCALKIVQQELDMPELPVTVLGLGKIAMQRMSPMSDLDLVFIFRDGYSMDTALKFVRRLQTALIAQLTEGIVYELDTRLRPSGKSGPATVFVDSFYKHHTERAHNWEHIALVPGRIVAGDREIGEQVMAIKSDILERDRDRQQWLSDAQKMWHRIVGNRIKYVDDDQFQAKLRSGGLMQAEYLAACYVTDAIPHLKSDAIGDFHQLVTQASNYFDLQVNLNDIIQFWSTVQIWERMLGLAGKSYRDMPEPYLSRLLAQVGCNSVDEFVELSAHHAKTVEDAMHEYFSTHLIAPDELEGWQEQTVKWC